MNKEEIYRLYDLYRTPKHIIEHCEKVALVAQKIAKGIKGQGIEVDIDSIVYAGLLHDLMRVVDIPGDHYKNLCKNASVEDILVWDGLKKQFLGVEHPYAIYRILISFGEEKIASIVRKHQFEAILSPEELPYTLEEKILTYADKRVLHNNIVSLKERFKDGAKRYYEKNKEKFPDHDYEQRIYDAYFTLEKELFDLLPFAPGDINDNELQHSI